MFWSLDHRGPILALMVFALAGPIGQAGEPPAPERIPVSQEECRKLSDRLQNNLSQLESLETAQILFVMGWTDGTAKVFGVITDESQRNAIAEMGLKALQREADQGLVGLRVSDLNTSSLVLARRPTAVPVDFVRRLEKILNTLPSCLLRVQAYSPSSQKLCLCGFIESPEYLQTLKQAIANVKGIRGVDTRDVVVAGKCSASSQRDWGYTDLYRGLRNTDGNAMTEAATALIRSGQGTVDVWYLRAAGHLMASQRDQAVGDIRVAMALDGSSFYRSQRFSPLQRVQGNLREELERMVAFGVCLSVAHD